MAIDTNETKNKLFGNIKNGKNQIEEARTIPTSHVEPTQIDHTRKEEETTHDYLLHSPNREHLSIQNKTNDLSPPKWQRLDKVTTLLTTEQKEGLDRVAKKIMKHRSKDLKGKDNKERITANTLIRSLIDSFLQKEESMQLEVLSSENDVYTWVRRLFK